MSVRIQQQDFDAGHELAALRAGRLDVGAVASFVGVCRDVNDGDTVRGMELEHYPGMTERAIEGMVAQARARWRVSEAVVIHRVGPIAPGEQIVFVAVASGHRGDAFEACAFLMDYLKTQAPFWKKERLADGSARWVDARASDDAALARWGVASRNA
ncbi:MAG: molybdenum cofactor biosynthesis protein MoaE [Betaproteobacteria bacterium]|nr:molybdenum cofactor biosynthesis protein MoaE [Betaproteobacteria bacterium]